MGSHSSDANDIRVRLTEAYKHKQAEEQKKQDSFDYERARKEEVYLTAFAQSFGQDLISLGQSLLKDLGAVNPQPDKTLWGFNEANKAPASLLSLFKPKQTKAQLVVGYVFKPSVYRRASRWSLEIAEEGLSDHLGLRFEIIARGNVTPGDYSQQVLEIRLDMPDNIPANQIPPDEKVSRYLIGKTLEFGERIHHQTKVRVELTVCYGFEQEWVDEAIKTMDMSFVLAEAETQISFTDSSIAKGVFYFGLSELAKWEMGRHTIT